MRHIDLILDRAWDGFNLVINSAYDLGVLVWGWPWWLKLFWFLLVLGIFDSCAEGLNRRRGKGDLSSEDSI